MKVGLHANACMFIFLGGSGRTPTTHPHPHTDKRDLPQRGRFRVTRHVASLDCNRWIHAQTHSRVSRPGWQGPDLSDRGRAPGGHMERGSSGGSKRQRFGTDSAETPTVILIPTLV